MEPNQIANIKHNMLSSSISKYLAFMHLMFSLVVSCNFRICSAHWVASRLCYTVDGRGNKSICGDHGLAIRNTRYAYNPWSHDQCVVNPHNRVDNKITSSITVPNNILTVGHITKSDIATQGKFTTKQRIPSIVDDPSNAYYPTGNWLGDVPSSHQRRRKHRHLPCCPPHSLTKLIARDKAMSTFWIVLTNHLRGEHWICNFGCSKVRL
jgi:hypothetical protein